MAHPIALAFAGILAAPSIIPQPAHIALREGVFAIRPDTAVVAEAEAAAEARGLIDALAPAMGFRLRFEDSSREENVIALRIGSGFAPEAYALETTTRAVRIRASSRAGLL